MLIKQIKIYDEHGNDTDTTRLLTDEELSQSCMDPETYSVYEAEYNNLFAPDGKRKKYVPAREYLREVRDVHLGAPLYFNEAKNFMMLGCHTADEKIMLYSGGYKKAADITEDDTLMGPDSKPRKVEKLIRGFGNMYTVKQSKSKDYTVSENHILSLKDRKGRIITKTVKELISLTLNKDGKIPGYLGYCSGLIEYDKEPTNKIDPYLLGLWLGNGTSDNPYITNSDHEVEEYLLKLFPDLSIYNNTPKLSTRDNFKYNLKKPFKKQLKALNLLNNKHIPDFILYGNSKDRLQCLAGLIDSDGCLNENSFNFYQKDETLIEQVIQLCKSLGLSARKNKSKKIFKAHITGDVMNIPVKVFRKKPSRNSNTYKSIIHLEPQGEQEYYGFQVSDDHLYLLEDYTVTHNSRGFGKSYSVAGLVAHEFLFDGRNNLELNNNLSAEILVGAFDSKYTSDILSKVELMLSNLPGAYTTMDRFGKERVYPCPFFKNYSGSWKEQVTAKYRKKKAGQWE